MHRATAAAFVVCIASAVYLHTGYGPALTAAVLAVLALNHELRGAHP
jgi:hypothetical protein